MRSITQHGRDRWDRQVAARRAFVFAAVVRLPTGFLTRDASDMLIALNRKLFFFPVADQDRTIYELRLKAKLRNAGVYSGPRSALNYLKELEKEGLLVKRLVDRKTGEPLSPDERGGTYQWFWVGELGMPKELAA